MEQPKILIVEDDDQIRETLLVHLSGNQYDVTGAANGNEAIPLLHGKEFRLVVLDLNMPYIDGFGVLKFIKSTFPATKVVVVTANRDLKALERCKSYGAEEVIWKPYDVEDLLRTIGRLLRKPAPTEENR